MDLLCCHPTLGQRIQLRQIQIHPDFIFPLSYLFASRSSVKLLLEAREDDGGAVLWVVRRDVLGALPLLLGECPF